VVKAQGETPGRLVQSIISPSEIPNAAEADTERKIILPFCDHKIALKKKKKRQKPKHFHSMLVKASNFMSEILPL